MDTTLPEHCQPGPGKVAVTLEVSAHVRRLHTLWIRWVNPADFDPEWQTPGSYAWSALVDVVDDGTSELISQARVDAPGPDSWATVKVDGEIVYHGYLRHLYDVLAEWGGADR